MTVMGSCSWYSDRERTSEAKVEYTRPRTHFTGTIGIPLQYSRHPVPCRETRIPGDLETPLHDASGISRISFTYVHYQIRNRKQFVEPGQVVESNVPHGMSYLSREIEPTWLA